MGQPAPAALFVTRLDTVLVLSMADEKPNGRLH